MKLLDLINMLNEMPLNAEVVFSNRDGMPGDPIDYVTYRNFNGPKLCGGEYVMFDLPLSCQEQGD